MRWRWPAGLRVARRPDPALEGTSGTLAAIADGGIAPVSVTSDVAADANPGSSGFSTFRRRSARSSAKPAEESAPPAQRIATPAIRSFKSLVPIDRHGFTGEQLMNQLQLREGGGVVNMGEPEASLILRKPMSPPGHREQPIPASPAGLTHVGRAPVGNARVSVHCLNDARLDPQKAYRSPLRPRRDPRLFSADRLPHAPGYEPAKAGDGDPLDALPAHRRFVGAHAADTRPHDLVVDLGPPSATSTTG